jgi:hypothetical protein
VSKLRDGILGGIAGIRLRMDSGISSHETAISKRQIYVHHFLPSTLFSDRVVVKNTRSFRRRLLAFLVDVILAHMVVAVMFGWWATSPDSDIRFGGSIVFFSSCREIQPNSEFLAQWDKVQDCNIKSDFIFPNRKLVVQKVDNSGSVTQIQEMRFSLDGSGRAVVALEVDLLMFIVLFFGASLFEASGQGATPGKILMGLRLYGIHNDRAPGSPKRLQEIF